MLYGEMPGMMDVMKAFNAYNRSVAIAFVNVQRRHQQHWHEHAKEYPCNQYPSLLHLFHRCKVTIILSDTLLFCPILNKKNVYLPRKSKMLK